MSLLGLLKGKGPNGFGFLSTADDVLQGVELSDKVFLVTGVNSGLGLETARALTARGATIIGLARTEEKAKTALASISADKGIPVACELSEPTSVRAAVEAVRPMSRLVELIEPAPAALPTYAPPAALPTYGRDRDVKAQPLRQVPIRQVHRRVLPDKGRGSGCLGGGVEPRFRRCSRLADSCHSSYWREWFYSLPAVVPPMRPLPRLNRHRSRRRPTVSMASSS